MSVNVRDAIEIQALVAERWRSWTDEQRARFGLEVVALQLADQLERRQKRQGIGLSELAKRAGTSKAEVRHLLSGRIGGLTLRSLVRIAVALGCEVDVRIRERRRRRAA